jgi:3-oxoacyl-[acyl-carrier protein] reductase
MRIFLVTGASKGIGRAISHRLIRAGHHVIGLARHAQDFPGELMTVDLAKRDETLAALEGLTHRYSFDGVVNNVGLVRPQPLGEIRLADLEDVLTVNLHSAVHTVQAILPELLRKKWGRIVNVSSLTILGMVERTAYAAAKAALVSFADHGLSNWPALGSPSMRSLLGRQKPSCFAPITQWAARARRDTWRGSPWGDSVAQRK